MTPFGWPVVPELYTKNARSFLGSALVLLYREAPDMFLILRKCLNLPDSSFSSPIRMILSSGKPAFLAASHAALKNGFCVTRALAPASFS